MRIRGSGDGGPMGGFRVEKVAEIGFLKERLERGDSKL